ncbi:hypothetical protein ASD02_07110 [Ensifer sp. Root1252]|nr:hypothetical protein ASD00_07245 [Ensifer sp. Root31]KQW58739.1 hypothetical protein ASD02_07110 [Ensifer sp. Root1252]KQW74442.1 hypothetical protein ASD03_07750 [Ensifer sp. Root127]KQY62149.1 hypothetical protein ASD52_16120 [Ensifer sp. Root142]KRC67575.1 hypothetical protein ASE32_10570 [Ensifer sp. Root231]OMQ41588.1 hypothetical protein BKP54_28020 [Ensifer sp. 1H6]
MRRVDDGLFRPLIKLVEFPSETSINATSRDEFGIQFHKARAYISAIETHTGRQTSGLSRSMPMLYIFSKPNFVQIAWNSKAPVSQSRVRNVVLDAPFGPLGFIRTSNVG